MRKGLVGLCILFVLGLIVAGILSFVLVLKLDLGVVSDLTREGWEFIKLFIGEGLNAVR